MKSFCGDYKLDLLKVQQEVQHGWSGMGKVKNLGNTVKGLTITYQITEICSFCNGKGSCEQV